MFERVDRHKTELLAEREGQRQSWHPGYVKALSDEAVVAEKTWWCCKACGVRVGIVRMRVRSREGDQEGEIIFRTGEPTHDTTGDRLDFRAFVQTFGYDKK